MPAQHIPRIYSIYYEYVRNLLTIDTTKMLMFTVALAETV